MTAVATPLLHLRGGGVAIVIDVSGARPVVVHWGADLGERVDLEQIPSESIPHSAYDDRLSNGLVPQASSGWSGRPLLEGHRAGGKGFSPRLAIVGCTPLEANGWAIELEDSDLAVSLTVEVLLSEQGMLRTRNRLRNLGDTPYSLLALNTTLPTGWGAAEILDLSGRWCREQHPQRQLVQQGTWLREYRHGRTGHDSSILTAVGTVGFSNRAGKVWATHLGYSGNHATLVEKGPAGSARILNGELFSPGEMQLAAGDEYETPWTYGAYSGAGLDGITAIFHDWVRARATHPKSARPVVLNTWEAVYFDHNTDNLLDLARKAADIGVERFVLDDGWFKNRRNDLAGLGDWYVDDDIWPDGLTELIAGVNDLGMEFGLWVEPEMVNEDSDVIRAHPDWISGPGNGRIPPNWRSQQVIDLVNPDAWNYIFDRISALLSENNIAYLKWDQNRDLSDMGHNGAASTHAQTQAAYRLFDALRAAHPTVEIESCSSGGGRVDLGILERTDRVWASDCNDALERQTIQRWTQSVLPPELVGSHVGPTRSHTTHRVHTLAFRAITAMFGHFGIEWEIRRASEPDLAELADAVALYKKHRALIHSGTAVNSDLPDAAYRLYGTVAHDQSEALYAFVRVATSADESGGRLGLPGLDPQAIYRVRAEFPRGEGFYLDRSNVGWIPSGVTASGALLEELGLAMPLFGPEQAILIHAMKVEG